MEHARTALATSRDIDSLPGIVFNGFVLLLGLLEAGTYSEALTTAETVLAEIQPGADDLETAMALMMRGKVQRHLLALDAARASHEEALRLSEAGPPVLQLSEMICMDLCADYALIDDWEAAHGYARRAPTLEPAIWFFMAGMFPWWLQVKAFLRAGARADAEAVVQRFEVYVDDYCRLRLPQLRSQAVLAEWDDDPDRAITCLEKALALADEIGLPRERCRILADLGALYQERGEDDRADDARARAAETVRELAADITDKEVRSAFLEAAPAPPLGST